MRPAPGGAGRKPISIKTLESGDWDIPLTEGHQADRGETGRERGEDDQWRIRHGPTRYTGNMGERGNVQKRLTQLQRGADLPEHNTQRQCPPADSGRKAWPQP